MDTKEIISKYGLETLFTMMERHYAESTISTATGMVALSKDKTEAKEILRRILEEETEERAVIKRLQPYLREFLPK